MELVTGSTGTELVPLTVSTSQETRILYPGVKQRQVEVQQVQVQAEPEVEIYLLLLCNPQTRQCHSHFQRLHKAAEPDK